MRTHVRRLAAPLWAAFAIFCAAPALAQGVAAEGSAPGRRVVVESFSGPQGSRMRASLVGNLEEHGYEVLDRSAVRDAALGLGITSRNLSEDEYPRVAQVLGVSAFLDGNVRRRGRNWSLTVTVRSGADGMVLGNETWSSRTVAGLRAIGRNGHERLAQFLDAAQPPPPNEPEPEPEPQPSWYEQQAPIAEPEPEPEPSRPAGSRFDTVRLALAFGWLTRDLATTAVVDGSQRGSATNFEEDRVYAGGGGEIGFDFEIYPLALDEDQSVPFVGLAARYRHSVGLSTTGPACLGVEPIGPDSTNRCTAPTDPTSVAASQSELYIGGRFRYRLGESRRDLQLLADIGWGKFVFDLAPKDLLTLERFAIIPPMEYTYLQLGAGASYGIVPTYLELGARFAYRLGFGVGTDAKRIWGTETSSTGGFSIGVDIRSEAPYISDGFYFNVGLEYFRFTTDFRGQTACAAPDAMGMCGLDQLWEPWPATDPGGSEVTGGLQSPVNDNYLRLQISIGFAFGAEGYEPSSMDNDADADGGGDAALPWGDPGAVPETEVPPGMDDERPPAY